MNRLFCFALLISFSLTLIAQESGNSISNSDVITMSKSGLAERTIVLTIEQGPTNFDTSPLALVELKKAGVSDAVLNAMLAASKHNGSQNVVSNSTVTATSADAQRLVEKALYAVGTMDKLSSITATRQLWSSVVSRSGTTASYEVERVVFYPDRIYMASHASGGADTKIVITPQFAYGRGPQGNGNLPPAMLDDQRSSMRFEIPYVAQHQSDFVFIAAGQETIGTEECDRLRLKRNDGNEEVWSLDSHGRLLRRTGKGASGEYSVDYSDFRWVDGMNVAFHRHVSHDGLINDITIKQYVLNPSSYSLPTGLFDPPPVTQAAYASNTIPTPSPSGGLTIRVLEEKSVPYVQKLGGGPSTSCNISGGSNTTFSANTIGNSTYGDANTTTALHMNCNTYDTTMNWPHVLNVMLVQASDGNAYMIACDRSWAWSKCVPLRAGDTFNARQTSKGLAVQAFNAKGKESEPTYAILQSKSLR